MLNSKVIEINNWNWSGFKVVQSNNFFQMTINSELFVYLGKSIFPQLTWNVRWVGTSFQSDLGPTLIVISQKGSTKNHSTKSKSKYSRQLTVIPTKYMVPKWNRLMAERLCHKSLYNCCVHRSLRLEKSIHQRSWLKPTPFLGPSKDSVYRKTFGGCCGSYNYNTATETIKTTNRCT